MNEKHQRRLLGTLGHIDNLLGEAGHTADSP